MVKKNIEKPTTFLNKSNPAHITIVDEGHTLLSQPDKYNNFPNDNHLDEIVKLSTKVILVFDEKQFLKLKSYWDNASLDKIINKIKKSFPEYEIHEYKLKTQLRMVCSQDTIDWIDNIIQNKEIKTIPSDDKFEIKIFDDCYDMYKEIKKRNKEVKLSRLLSTFDYIHKKDGKEYYIEEGKLKLPWNVVEKEAWAQREEGIDQIGSIYTIQGFDLNYAGVILGPSLSYDETSNKLKIDITKYQDTEAFRVSEKMKNSLNDTHVNELKEKIILNSLNVLLKRPIKGLYIYASDEKLRNYLETIS